MTVICIATGEPLTRDQIEIRESAASPERAARVAISDAFVFLRQLAGSPPVNLTSEGSAAYTRALDHARQALAQACAMHGLDAKPLEIGMRSIGDVS